MSKLIDLAYNQERSHKSAMGGIAQKFCIFFGKTNLILGLF